MRLRNVKNANNIIGSSFYVVNNPMDYRGRWKDLFDNENPIHVEIGMGKGRFIKNNALKHPDINYIGIEKYSSVLARAVQKMPENILHNLRLLCFDATNIEDIFDKEIDIIYLNFSDPWPKERHIKRRLTSDVFLKLYDNLFKGTKQFIMKTDNYNLYEYSKEQFLRHNYNINTTCFDVNSMTDDNVMTEYEEKFLKNGNKIYKIESIKD